jgi:prevent-host-death family protein
LEDAMAWQVQEAKQRFSEVVRAAEAGEPQIVTRHGGEVAVVIDMESFRRLGHRPRKTFVDHLLAAPKLLDDDEADELFARDSGVHIDRVVFD